MDLTLNGRPVLRASVLLPRVGVWVADVTVDTDEDLLGAQDLVVEGVTLRGAVHRGGVAYGRWSGRLVGGAAGLPEAVPPVAQYTTTLGTALADVLREAGETLSATSADLSRSVTRWHRAAGTGAQAVGDVARAAGLSWRVLLDGTVWVGAETWATLTPTGVELLDQRPEVGRYELGGDAAALLSILPGLTLSLPGDGVSVRVGLVEHRLDAGAFRTVVTAEPTEKPAGRFLDAFSRLVAALTRRVDYQALYPARVAAQRGDGTLDLIPDDAARVAPCTGVPIRTGLPGVAVTVPAGARVLLSFEAGDPARPVATLWEAATVTTLKVNGSTTKAARDGEAVNRSAALDAWFSAVQLATGVAPPTGAIGAVSGGSDVVRIP